AGEDSTKAAHGPALFKNPLYFINPQRFLTITLHQEFLKGDAPALNEAINLCCNPACHGCFEKLSGLNSQLSDTYYPAGKQRGRLAISPAPRS
ncbi:MAG: hypothetical protein LUO94_09855, partial [Methylococcaceae bacterium]|nr:hypothetical protein [Methylococcaceae bacterium]